MSVGRERLTGAEERVHRALAVRRHENQAARGRGAVGGRRRVESDTGLADVVREFAPRGVFLDLADESRDAPQAREARHGVGGRAAGNNRRRAHRRIKFSGPRFVDERHRAFAQSGLQQIVVLGARDRVDDGVANAQNIK